MSPTNGSSVTGPSNQRFTLTIGELACRAAFATIGATDAGGRRPPRSAPNACHGTVLTTVAASMTSRRRRERREPAVPVGRRSRAERLRHHDAAVRFDESPRRLGVELVERHDRQADRRVRRAGPEQLARARGRTAPRRPRAATGSAPRSRADTRATRTARPTGRAVAATRRRSGRAAPRPRRRRPRRRRAAISGRPSRIADSRSRERQRAPSQHAGRRGAAAARNQSGHSRRLIRPDVSAIARLRLDLRAAPADPCRAALRNA